MFHKAEMVPSTFLFCPKCAGRVETRHVPIGATIACDACGTKFTADVRAIGVEETSQEEDHHDAVDLVVTIPSPRLFLAGVFDFPFRRDGGWRWLLLSLGAAAIFAAGRLAFWCHAADGEQVDRVTRVLLWNGMLFSVTFGSFVLIGWIVAASAFGLNLIRETSHGADRIRDWPRLLALEGLGEWVIVGVALVLAVATGASAALLSNRFSFFALLAQPSVVGVTAAILFPILLLSMLETDSKGWPFSAAVWRSVPRYGIAWVAFHAAALAAGIAGVALWTLTMDRGWPAEAIVGGGATAAFWMIYCRLLGRLAGYCSGRM